VDFHSLDNRGSLASAHAEVQKFDRQRRHNRKAEVQRVRNNSDSKAGEESKSGHVAKLLMILYHFQPTHGPHWRTSVSAVAVATPAESPHLIDDAGRSSLQNCSILAPSILSKVDCSSSDLSWVTHMQLPTANSKPTGRPELHVLQKGEAPGWLIILRSQS
jgi:hypothetical protein